MILWDEPKRLANIIKHGMDFADLDEAFFIRATLVAAKEGRLAAIGTFAGRTIIVIFTPLGHEAVSVISMRPASTAERQIL